MVEPAKGWLRSNDDKVYGHDFDLRVASMGIDQILSLPQMLSGHVHGSHRRLGHPFKHVDYRRFPTVTGRDVESGRIAQSSPIKTQVHVADSDERS